ncbi:MAG: phosphoribosylformylglycinamidine cyclo-ligase [Firmicutes bacterium]|nr:phosphoribosylformylglycinamidine cyclo-ligase [Bacillota bacterium]
MSYRESGVDIDAGERAVELMRESVRRTFTPGVLSDIGGFGGLFRLDVAQFRDPVLVAGTDGVGTKLKLAFALDRHDTVGIDAVAMCVNDVLVSGARPLFFLDYIACGHLVPERVAQIVSGVAEGCMRAGCALIGGETAEMPGFYPDGEYDIAGFAVGVVDREQVVDGSGIRPGDVVIGLASSGLHSNGFSLARRVLLQAGGFLLSDTPSCLDRPLGQVLLEPTRIYARAVADLARVVQIRGMAHITGGGLIENPPRMLPAGTAIELEVSSWPTPPIFGLIQEMGNVSAGEMARVFNMGIGYIVVVRDFDAGRALEALAASGEVPYMIGRITPGDGTVRLVGGRT